MLSKLRSKLDISENPFNELREKENQILSICEGLTVKDACKILSRCQELIQDKTLVKIHRPKQS